MYLTLPDVILYSNGHQHLKIQAKTFFKNISIHPDFLKGFRNKYTHKDKIATKASYSNVLILP